METLQPDLFATFDKLQKAIKAGNVEKSKEFAASLAKQKVTVQVKEKEDESSGTSDDFISVKVYIEDKEGTGANTLMQLMPSMKIKDLKAKMLREHGFAPEIQRWIMGKKIVNDEETLKKNRIKSGSSIFLYLLSPQSVGISKEEYDRLYGDNTSIGGRTGMQDTVQMGDPQQRRRNPSTQSSQTSEVIPDLEDPESSIPLEPPPPPPVGVRVPSQRNRPPPPPDPPVLSYADVGWTCPKCTFRNEPTRPGCEMCAADRPADYAVPQGVAYEMTDKEKRRLQRERDAERLAEESDRQEAQQLDPMQAEALLRSEQLRELDDLDDSEALRQRLILSGIPEENIRAIIDAQRVVPAVPKNPRVVEVAGGDEQLSMPMQESGDYNSCDTVDSNT